MALDLISRFVIEKLSAKHNRKSFSCGIEALDDYIKKQATQDERRHIAVTYILHDKQENKVAGFYSLASTTIEAQHLSEEVTRKLPNYPLIPATLIGRLAIDQYAQGNQLGEILLMDGLHRSYESSKAVASFAVVVEAINKKAVSFYKKYGFIDLATDKKLLYMAMKAIKELQI